LKFNRRFGGRSRLHIRGQKINQARNKNEAGRKESLLFLVGSLPGFFFDPEDGGGM
jgi:hypothetical protein